MLKKLVSATCITAAIVVPFAFASPASAADCIGYATQTPLYTADTNGDGHTDKTIWYPAMPNDVSPAGCLDRNQSVPKVIS